MLNRAKDTLMMDSYKRFQGQGYTRKEEFYLADKGEVASGEDLKKKEDNESYYRLRYQNNTQRYIDMLSHKIMSETQTPRAKFG